MSKLLPSAAAARYWLLLAIGTGLLALVTAGLALR